MLSSDVIILILIVPDERVNNLQYGKVIERPTVRNCIRYFYSRATVMTTQYIQQLLMDVAKLNRYR